MLTSEMLDNLSNRSNL